MAYFPVRNTSVSDVSHTVGLTYIIQMEKDDFITDSYSILTRWTKLFTQLLNLLGFNDVRQAETHTAKSLVPEQSGFAVEMAIEKLKRHKSSGADQIPSRTD